MPTLDINAISSGIAVRGRTWIDGANLANYIRGRGRVLVPIHGSGISIPSGSTHTFRFRAFTSASSQCRAWQVMHNSAFETSGGIEVRAPAVTGATQTMFVGSPYETASNFGEYVEYAQGVDGEEEITIDIHNIGDDAVRILSLSCTERPRGRLTLDATDLGVDDNTEAAREPIYEVDNAGLRGIKNVITDFQYAARGGVAAFSVNTTAAKSEGAGVDTLLWTVPAAVLAQRIKTGDVTGNIKFRVYAKTEFNTDTGRFRVLTNSGASTTITIPSGSHSAYAWYPSTAGAPASVDVDCEDASTSTGLQGATFDYLIPDYRLTSGVGHIYIAAACFWQDGTP